MDRRLFGLLREGLLRERERGPEEVEGLDLIDLWLKVDDGVEMDGCWHCAYLKRSKVEKHCYRRLVSYHCSVDDRS